jgi:serine phosphatase RsbU (regulator of sigma subunit)
MDATLIRFDINNPYTIEYTAANHNPILIKQQGEMIKCPNDKQPIGADDFSNTKFSTHQIRMQEGDVLYVFSDGYADQFGGGERDKKMQRSNFYRILQQYHQLPAQEQRELLKKIHLEWRGNKDQTDDIVVAGLFF